MFGHDNQENNQDHNDGNLTVPAPSTSHTDAGNDDAGTAPLPAPQKKATDPIGGFLTGADGHGTDSQVPTGADDLLDIKQEALQALTPLVGHLDQSPEEKFRTTMMMIQASDDHALVKVAYEAAKQIEDEKERAQALLDIVNEINYFTQHQQAAA